MAKSGGKFDLVPIFLAKSGGKFVFVPIFYCLFWLNMAGICFGSYFVVSFVVRFLFF